MNDMTVGMSFTEVRNRLIETGVPRDSIRTAILNNDIRGLYNKLYPMTCGFCDGPYHSAACDKLYATALKFGDA